MVPDVGPPCPHCHRRTSFYGVGPSIRADKCVELYRCEQHPEVYYEADIKRNKHDNDYKDPNSCL
jgi:hypothetical protein